MKEQEIERVIKEVELAFKEKSKAGKLLDKATLAQTKAHKRLQLALAEMNSLRFD